MNSEPCDWIHLTKMSLPCVLGVFPWERRRRQTLQVEISVRLDLEVAAPGDLSTTLDYGALFERVRFIARHGRWPLVESLAFALLRHLLSPPAPGESHPHVEEARVKLCKPEALQSRAIPSIEVQRRRSWCELQSGEPAQVRIASLQETEDTGAYHVDLAPGAEWHPPKSARVHVITGRPTWGDRLLYPGNAWGPSDDALRNAGADPCRLLVVAEPPIA